MGDEIRSLAHSGSPRAFSPRDDKVWGRYAVSGIVTTRSLSLRGGSEARDAAIHRVSRNADGFVSSVTGSQWIATGFALAMTRCGEGMQSVASLQHALCHCKEGAERGTRQSIVSWETRTGMSARVLDHTDL